MSDALASYQRVYLTIAAAAEGKLRLALSLMPPEDDPAAMAMLLTRGQLPAGGIAVEINGATLTTPV